MSRNLSTLVEYIHCVNQYWHLALELSEHKMAQLFKRRKATLQRELLSNYIEHLRLDFDEEISSQNAQDVYVIRLNTGGDACHIPKSDLEELDLL